MVEVREYYLPPTRLIPNSPNPLLHYPVIFLPLASNGNLSLDPAQIHDVFVRNAWRTQWIFRYGPTQASHYHSGAHECMVVLSGSARIRFGVADTSSDLEESTHGHAYEDGGIEIEVSAGDAFVLPAGTAHKTFDTRPSRDFALLTPGDGHGINDGDTNDSVRRALENIQLDGFTMVGAYPDDGSEWDFKLGGEDEISFGAVRMLQRPEKDPILGTSPEGLCQLWS